VRQPLARALVYLPPGSPTPPPGVVEDELNVDVVEAIDELSDVPLTYELVPNFKLLGPRLGSRVQQLRSAMGSVDGAAAAAALAAGQPVVVELADGPVELNGDEVETRVRAQPGFAVSRDGAEVVALDLTLDDDLRRRGLAREVIRNVQELRKTAGLEVSDWIHLHLVGLDDLEPLFEAIGREVLARTIATTPPEGGGGGAAFEVDEVDTGTGTDGADGAHTEGHGAGRRVEMWVVKA
jgi:isoleucyl-tRNA synthetase